MAAVGKTKPDEEELGDLLKKTYVRLCKNGHLNVDGCVLPLQYKNFSDAIENLEVRGDDLWVCGFPKSGTTWVQEMVWCIVNGLDSDRSGLPMTERFPLLETSIFTNQAAEALEHDMGGMMPPFSLMDSTSYISQSASPRFIKSHFPPGLLPRELRTGEKKAKIVYVCRNPKDTCISFYHYSKLCFGYEGTFEEFCKLFLGDKVFYGSIWKHVRGFWNRRNDRDMLFLKYEDMKKDLPSVIKKTATYLGKNLTNDQVSLLTYHLSFSRMKEDPAVNHEGFISLAQNILQIKQEGVFMRSGKTEQWKTAMTPELVKRFDDRSLEDFDGTGLSF